MSTHTSVASFTNSIAKYPARIEAATKATVLEAAKVAKATTLGTLASTSGGDLVLSGVGKSGRKIGVNYKVAGTVATVQPTGPVPLIEGDTKAHDIPKVRKRGRQKSNILVIGGNVITGPIHHPGTHGKHPWRKGVNLARPLIARVMNTTFRRLF